MARHDVRLRRRWQLAGPLALMATVAAMLWPVAPAAPAVITPSALVTTTAPAGTAAVGALFTVRGGQLRTHFCTASVVDSPAGDLLLTAAHCVQSYSDTSPAGLAFVPGYNGTAPYGAWTVTRIFVDQAWASTADPDDDVAFLTVAPQPGWDTPIQDVTGGERLGIGHPSAGLVRVIGYPDTRDTPLSCQNQITAFSSTQMQFDCDGYTMGTSGSPFLVGVDPATGEGTVIGAIGGYQEGGDSPDVSYAATFGRSLQALYGTALSQG